MRMEISSPASCLISIMQKREMSSKNIYIKACNLGSEHGCWSVAVDYWNQAHCIVMPTIMATEDFWLKVRSTLCKHIHIQVKAVTENISCMFVVWVFFVS